MDVDVPKSAEPLIDSNTNSNKKIKKKKHKKKKKIKIKFRNYVPKSEHLRKYCIPSAKPIEFSDDFKKLIEQSKILNHDSFEIIPKKSNWDLKRDCESQLQELQYQTKVSIRKLIQMKKLKQMENESDSNSSSDGYESGSGSSENENESESESESENGSGSGSGTDASSNSDSNANSNSHSNSNNNGNTKTASDSAVVE